MIELKGVDPQMIANNIDPFEPTHPGELLKDEIEYRGISQKKLAVEMGVSYTILNYCCPLNNNVLPRSR